MDASRRQNGRQTTAGTAEERRDLLPAETTPTFRTEADAADWYATHDTSRLPTEPAKDVEPAPGPLVTVAVRVSAREVAELKRRAARLGIGHTTYVRMLINRHVLSEPPMG